MYLLNLCTNCASFHPCFKMKLINTLINNLHTQNNKSTPHTYYQGSKWGNTMGDKLMYNPTDDTPSVDCKQLKRLDTLLTEPTNKNKINFPKVVK